MLAAQFGAKVARLRSSAAKRPTHPFGSNAILQSSLPSTRCAHILQNRAFSHITSRATSIAQQYTRHSATYAVIARSKLAISIRQYSSSSRDSEGILLEGKTEGTLSSLWSRYKLYAIGAGGAIAAVSLAGLAASAIAIGGIASIAGGAYMWYRSRVAHQQSVLRTLYEPLIAKNRKEIERFIGPYELPEPSTIAADADDVKTPTGGTEKIIRNVFYADGKYGKALVRALGVKQEDGSFKLRKLMVDIQDFRRGTQETMVLVDESPKPKIVDAVSFNHYNLTDFVEIKRASRAAEVKAAKQQRKNAKLYANKPPKKSG